METSAGPNSEEGDRVESDDPDWDADWAEVMACVAKLDSNLKTCRLRSLVLAALYHYATAPAHLVI